MSTESIEKVQIVDLLPDVFEEISKNKDQIRFVDDVLMENYKIPRGTLNELMINLDAINKMNEEEICALTIVLYEVTKNESINPTLHFTQKEINKTKKYKAEDESIIEFPYVFEGVLRTSEKEFLTVMSYKDIIKLWNGGLLTYNYETQRASKKTLLKSGKLKRTQTIILKSVKNITRLMIEGKFLPSTLVFNILADGTDSIEYENGDLIIEEGTKINLIDGRHRLEGMSNVLEQNPNFEGRMEVSIRHYDLNAARYLIGLLNTVNRFDKNLVKFNTDDSIGGLIAKDLIQIKELRDRVETESTAVKKKLNMLTNYAILAESINSIFDPQTTKEQYDITKILKEFYGYLISAYPEDFTKNMAVSRKNSWFNHHNLHVGFIVIAKKMYDIYGIENFPVTKITGIIDAIDLRKGTGSAIDKIMLEQGNRNSNQSKALIRKFFEDQLEQISI